MKYHNHTFIPESFPSAINAGFGTRDFTSDAFQKSFVSLNQVHGDAIYFVDTVEDSVEADAAVTDKQGALLTIRTADCCPILFYDPETNLIAASHQGWKGSLLRLPEKVVNYLKEKGAHPQNLRIAIGPSIGACCYSIYGERKNEFETAFPDWRNDVIQESLTGTALNLLKLNYLQLLAAGVLSENIEYVPVCTKCDEKRFYSYNRGDTDVRMINFIGRT